MTCSVILQDPLLIGCDVRNDFRNDENIEQQRSNSSKPRYYYDTFQKVIDYINVHLIV